MEGFNPRARVGRDAEGFGWESGVRWFQSTRPRGARRNETRIDTDTDTVSIHAPAWGATQAGAVQCVL